MVSFCHAEEDKHTFRLYFGLSFPFTVQFEAMCIIRALTTTTTTTEEQQAQKAAAMLCMLSLLIKTISQPSRDRANRLSQAFFEFWTMLSNALAGYGFGESISIEKYLPTWLLRFRWRLTAVWISLAGCQCRKLSAVACPNSACWVFTYTSAVGLFLTLLVNNISLRNLFGSPLYSYSIQKYSSLFTLVLVFSSLKRSLFFALRLSAAQEKYDCDIYVYIVHIHSLTFEINEHSSTPIRHLFSLAVRGGDVPRPNGSQLGS